MEIQDRTLEFGIKILRFAGKMPRTISADILIKQLVRSGTSIGANMEEADGAASKRDFINKVVIARKEAKETRYWLTLVKKADLINNQANKNELDALIGEAAEIMRILSAIINRSKE